VETTQQPQREQFLSATNTVLHDAEHPSALILPVVPGK
jgi:predicted acyl esterase